MGSNYTRLKMDATLIKCAGQSFLTKSIWRKYMKSNLLYIRIGRPCFHRTPFIYNISLVHFLNSIIERERKIISSVFNCFAHAQKKSYQAIVVVVAEHRTIEFWIWSLIQYLIYTSTYICIFVLCRLIYKHTFIWCT